MIGIASLYFACGKRSASTLVTSGGHTQNDGWRFSSVKTSHDCGNAKSLNDTEQDPLGLLYGEHRVLAIGPSDTVFRATLDIDAKGAFDGREFPETLCLVEVVMDTGGGNWVGQMQVRNQEGAEHRGCKARILFGKDSPVAEILLTPVHHLRFYGDILFSRGWKGPPFRRLVSGD